MSKATIKDVARRAGVSLGTASRVINRHKSVSDRIRRRVTLAITELGYEPDAVAQSMRKGATRTIGIVIRDITVPALADFVKSAQEVLHEAGYALIITCSDDRKERELELLNLLSRRRIDGLIMTTANESDPDLMRARQHQSYPIVLLDRETPPELDAMTVSHRDGLRRGVDYLLDLGHRRIALITGAPTVYPARERIRGYEEAHAARGTPVDPRLLRSVGFSADSSFLEASALLSLADRPTAIICGGINMLSGALRAIQSHGLRIPQDISLIGSNDSDLARLATPPVTVIHWSFRELGEAAAHTLLDRIANGGQGAPRRIVFPAELVMRASCGAPPR